MPYEWAVFGLGIDKEFSGYKPEATWGLIFDPAKIRSKIIMTNDPFVGIPIAAFYLFKSLRKINEFKLEQIKNLLINQKPYVEAYTDFRADYYLATKNCPVIVASSAYIWRSMREYPHIDFLIPKEGTLVTIENCAIPATSTKEELVYEFLKFIFSREAAINRWKNCFFPDYY